MKKEPSIKLTAEELEIFNKHQAALEAYYDAHGVGETTKHRLKFWESQHPGGYYMSHDPNDEQRVAVFEMTWLADNFPQDMKFC